MRKNLVLHSDQLETNMSLDIAAKKLFSKSNPIIAYIPSNSDPKQKHFNNKVNYYQQIGFTNLVYFDLDAEYEKNKENDLNSFDGIFLSGGNTSNFLATLIKRNCIQILRAFVSNGGVLIGVSAGSIILTPDISICSIYNEFGNAPLNAKSLNLVDFEFYPHLNWNREQSIQSLIEYTRNRDSVVYACNDGEGIIVEGDKFQYYGEVLRFENGSYKTVE